MRLTAEDLVRSINNLPRSRQYHYINPATKTIVVIDSIELPNGPVYIKRFNPDKGETLVGSPVESISAQMIWRVANAFSPNQPVNIDRILGASYNTRSAFETLLAYTPQFYVAYPGRIEIIDSATTIKHGHKHLLWLPDQPHEAGTVTQMESDLVISEIPSKEVVYDSLAIPDSIRNTEIDIDIQRRHVQIQIALIMIGRHLKFKTWLAQNDKGIEYQGKTLAEIEGVIPDMREGTLISNFSDAVRAALLIDCIWFEGDKGMPAVFEVEHSTGVTSGLSRMKNFQDHLPSFNTRYVIVAPDEDKDKVVRETNKPQFASLKAVYLPYSAVEELWYLCEHRKLSGVTSDFIDTYLEQVLVS